jgi:hypothetical protein
MTLCASSPTALRTTRRICGSSSMTRIVADRALRTRDKVSAGTDASDYGSFSGWRLLHKRLRDPTEQPCHPRDVASNDFHTLFKG